MATCMACKKVDLKFKPWNIKFIGLRNPALFQILGRFVRFVHKLCFAQKQLQIYQVVFYSSHVSPQYW